MRPGLLSTRLLILFLFLVRNFSLPSASPPPVSPLLSSFPPPPPRSYPSSLPPPLPLLFPTLLFPPFPCLPPPLPKSILTFLLSCIVFTSKHLYLTLSIPSHLAPNSNEKPTTGEHNGFLGVHPQNLHRHSFLQESRPDLGQAFFLHPLLSLLPFGQR